jgi:hypothetical protein
MAGIGLDSGICSDVPLWTSLSKNPAVLRAVVENGGLLISP